ncbi:GntR family transcriptional regulator [Miniphocaeibacter massiliensis]|uniref:GntR family transcriptional regulator n=1 Tax=Miniphocaeibacter massiliensis TaxID=2041841 RepID=UPI000C1BB762|nr:GntR family transcriptional regulator [Miniphocaeibacter massiliensis]
MINKLSLNEQIYETLKREIFTHKIESGSLLVNKDLQERFEVSSSPIRDAINRLERDGLIEKITRAGAQVLIFDYNKTKEINELMTIITIGAFELFFKNVDRKQLEKELESLLVLQEYNLNSDKYFYYDYCFHKLFFEYSGNQKLVDLYKQFSGLSEMAVRSLDKITSSDSTSDNRLKSFTLHQKIVEAFKNDDLDAAKECIREHYQHADDVFKEYYN